MKREINDQITDYLKERPGTYYEFNMKLFPKIKDAIKKEGDLENYSSPILAEAGKRRRIW